MNGDVLRTLFYVVTLAGCTCPGGCYYFHDDSEPTYLVVRVGHYVLLNCEVDFEQAYAVPYMVKWRKDGEEMLSWYNDVMKIERKYKDRIQFLNEEVEGYGRASINLTAIRESDGGWYECKVLFPNRTPISTNNGTWFHVTIYSGDILEIPPINQTVMEGEEAQFMCSPKYNESKIVWCKDDIPIDVYQALNQRTVRTEDGTLIIYPTEMTDTGEYRCIISHPDGRQQNASAFLDVQFKAKVIYAQQEVFLAYGKQAVLDCHFRANPPLTNLRWEKDGFLYDPYNVPGVYYKRNGSLFFSRVDETHNGYYSCTPFNELGTQGPSPTIHVIVQRIPIFTTQPRNIYWKKLGETLEIPCDAKDGMNGHKPIIVWYRKDGSSLPVSRYSIKDGNLTIINIHDEDRGAYICSATNQAGTVTVETELVVDSIPPDAPHNVTAVASTRNVHLRWAAGKRRQHSTYSVWFRSMDSTEWKTYDLPPNIRTLEATITNLSSGREYEFMILSKNKHGDGLFSTSIRVWTKGFDGEAEHFREALHPLIGSPRNVTLHIIPNGYLLTWDAPDYGLQHLDYYKVRWFQGPDEVLYGEANTRNNSYFVTGLREGHYYEFQVTAISTEGQESRSDRIHLNLPSFLKMKAISTAVISGMAFLFIALIGVYFARKKWRHKNEDASDSKSQSKPGSLL